MVERTAMPWALLFLLVSLGGALAKGMQGRWGAFGSLALMSTLGLVVLVCGIRQHGWRALLKAREKSR